MITTGLIRNSLLWTTPEQKPTYRPGILGGRGGEEGKGDLYLIWINMYAYVCPPVVVKTNGRSNVSG